MKFIIKSVLNKIGADLVRFTPGGPMGKALSGLFARNNVDCVFDVGANMGQYGQFLRRIGFEGIIISFEPVESCLRELAHASHADPRWHIVEGALGDMDGTLALNVSQGTDLTSALPASAYGKSAFPDIMGRSVDVGVRRLDGLYEHLRADHRFERPFLKMDTQGYDLNVLAGASGCTASLVGLQTEVSFKAIYDGMPDACMSLNAIRTAGFEPVAIVPVHHDPGGALVEVDIVAQRR